MDKLTGAAIKKGTAGRRFPVPVRHKIYKNIIPYRHPEIKILRGAEGASNSIKDIKHGGMGTEG